MKLSILIAAYNVEKFITQCIDSCHDEELVSFYEIVVVNDGSTDETKKILDSFEYKFKNIKVINKLNEGLGAARNTGLDYALGEYVWMIDGDDFLEPNAISKILLNINEHSYDVFAFNYNIIKSGLVYNKYQNTSNKISKPISGSNYYSLHYQNSYTWQYIFKKEIFDNFQIRFMKRINMQDSEIFPRIMYHAKEVIYLDFTVYNYVQHENSFTNTQNAQKRINYFESIITVKSSLDSFAKEIQINDPILYQGIQKKIISLHEVVFNHLVFFDYSNSTFKYVINLLKQHNFYPLKYKPVGKLKWVKIALNIHPLLAKKLINLMRK